MNTMNSNFFRILELPITEWNVDNSNSRGLASIPITVLTSEIQVL